MREFAFVIILLIRCSSSDHIYSDTFSEFNFGWAGSPEELDKKPFGYYYKRVYGEVETDNKIKPLDSFQIQISCMDSATKNSKVDIINELVMKSIMGASGVNDPESSGKVIAKELNASIQSVFIKQCEPSNYEYPFRCWQINKVDKCEIPTEVQPSGNEWKYCQCTVFVGIPGGRQSIVERAMAIEKSKALK